MRPAALLVLLALSLSASGCGGDDEDGSAAPRTTATTTPAYATVPEDPARTDEECVELWNAFMRIGDAGQRSDLDTFLELVERGFDEAIVAYRAGQCEMLLLRGRRRAEYFFAPEGRGEWIAGPVYLTSFDVTDLPEPNARPDRDGILTPIR